MKLFDASFLSRPSATVSANTVAVSEVVRRWARADRGHGGGAAGPLPSCAARRGRRPRRSAGWAAAPFTGISASPLLAPLALTTVRYLLSALGACAWRSRSRAATPSREGGRSYLASSRAAIVASLAADFSLGHPAIPRPLYPLAGGALGASLGAVVPRGAEWRRPRTALAQRPRGRCRGAAGRGGAPRRRRARAGRAGLAVARTEGGHRPRPGSGVHARPAGIRLGQSADRVCPGGSGHAGRSGASSPDFVDRSPGAMRARASPAEARLGRGVSQGSMRPESPSRSTPPVASAGLARSSTTATRSSTPRWKPR